MTDVTSFRASLVKERAALVPLLDQPELPSLCEEADAAEEVAQSNRVKQLTTFIHFGNQRQYLREHEAKLHRQRALDQAARELRQRVTSLKSTSNRAEKRVKELDRLLTANDDAKHAKTELAQATSEIDETRSRIDQLSEIQDALREEIATLERERGIAIAERGADDLRSRMGDESSASSADLSAIGRDLDSRRETLVAAQSAIDPLKAALPPLEEQRDRLRNKYLNARGRMAELAFYEALPLILPAVAEMAACGHTPPRTRDLALLIDEEQRRIARTAIQREMAEPINVKVNA